MNRALWVVVVVGCSSNHTALPDAPDGPPDTLALTATSHRLAANGIVKAKLTAVIHDGGGGAIAGREVTLASDGTATIEPATATTDASGAITATFASSDIGDRHITATSADLTANVTITMTDPCAAPRFPNAPAVGMNFAVAGDFNGDGVLDLVGTTGPELALAQGNLDGSFQPLELVPGSASGMRLVAGDFNGDGALDVAVTSSPTTVSVMFGHGDFTLDGRLDLPVAAGEAIVTGDFDGDGKLDIAVAGAASTTPPLTILFSNGDGTFTAVVESSDVTTNNTVALAAADVDGDHITDLITSDDYLPSVVVHRQHA
ncbi:MAG TPA: FG-GAP-like repeat-containing protein, partial [Kofleriaceae bacterium]|nr:FG-GAP-like repeat-containing protein [Kofleriaceae bacterium]